jgi:hypothetical protein
MKLDELKAVYPDLTFEEVGQDTWDEDASGFCLWSKRTFTRRARHGDGGRSSPRGIYRQHGRIRKMLVKWDLSRCTSPIAYELGRAEMAIRHGLRFSRSDRHAGDAERDL